MSDASPVVVTGAHSYLGQHLLDGLASDPGVRVVALITPWAEAPVVRGSNLQVLRADLSQPLGPDARAAVRDARAVVHLAWSRGRSYDDVVAINQRMIDNLLDPIADPSRFFFVSSAAGAPAAFSVYGRSKWAAAEWVRSRGGTVVVCGLVVDQDPKGPYRLMCQVAKRSPIALRVRPASLNIYPVELAEVVAKLRTVALAGAAPGIYRLFATPLGFNSFLERLEQETPRARLKVTVNPQLILTAAAMLKSVRVMPSICDRLQSLFYKDHVRLMEARPLQPAGASFETSREEND